MLISYVVRLKKIHTSQLLLFFSLGVPYENEDEYSSRILEMDFR